MENTNHPFYWLELVERPAFCVKDNTVIAVNSAAKHHMLQNGTNIDEIVTENRSEYENFQNGCLYLNITVAGLLCNACVSRIKEYDIFLFMPDIDDAHLQALSLASQQLRIPLTNIMTVADQLSELLKDSETSTQQQIGKINRGLFQLLRIIGNMSDAGSYQNIQPHQMENLNLSAQINEVMEKIQTFADRSGAKLQYTGLDIPIFGLACSEKLERAIYNLISNAIKFSADCKTVEVKLTRQDSKLCFTVCNYNSEPVDAQTFWNRYRRNPSIEDSRYGLGLGMSMVAATAALHNGTVLIDHPSPDQTRVSMTIAVTKTSSDTVKSPIMRLGDYAGGRDKALLELSEILSTDAYKPIN